MRTWVKVVFVLSIITGIIVSAVSALYIMPSEYSTIAIVKELKSGERYIPDIGHYILFWASIFVIVVLFILLLVTLFWRNSKKNLVIQNGDRKQITIQLEAIKSIINAKIVGTHYFSTFNTKVKISRNKKITCKVKGDIISDTDISGKMKSLEDEIDQIIKDMFGSDEKLITTKVTVKAKGKQTATKETRVV